MLPVPDFKVEKKENYNFFGRIKVKLLVIVGFLVVVIFFGQLIFANKLATDGGKLSQIEKEIQGLEEQNNILRAKIAQESSLVNISQKAQNLGFEKPTTVILP